MDETGRILHKETRPTPPEGQTAPEPVVQAQIALARDLRARALGLGIQVEGVGFGHPNMIEGPHWIQRLSNNVPGLEGFALRPPLAQALGERIAMDNDVMTASFAEYHFGDGHIYERAFLMFIGTGIAAGIFTEGGRRLRFISGWTGDTGHIIVDPHGPPCTCGGRGCLEAVATGPAIRQQALAAAQNGKSPALAARLAAAGDLSPRDVAEAAEAGDEAARRIWQEAGWYLGIALTSYLHIFDPRVILVGGGIAEAGDLLLEPIGQTLAALGSPYYLRHLQAVMKAALGADAGLIGAAALILAPEASL